MNNVLRTVCESNNVRVTTVRKNLFELLAAESPVAMSEFFEITKQKGFDTVSVYRTLDLFRKLDCNDPSCCQTPQQTSED